LIPTGFQPAISSTASNQLLTYGAKLMDTALQFLVIVGGLTFSLAASLLIEELIFGRIFRVVFARRPSAQRVETGRAPSPPDAASA
jgi:hypothetical protein